MNWLLLSAALTLGASTGAERDAFENGTLIFLENCNSVVEYSTRADIGHVAMVFRSDAGEGAAVWIYEATPGEVRRVLLNEYYAELARINKRRDSDDQVRVWALRPKKPYSDDEVSRMREYLDEQVGRRYSIKNYVRKKPGDGIHCAELASNTLNRSGRFVFEQCHRIHPSALFAAMKSTHHSPVEVQIPTLTAKESWCVRANRRWSEWSNWCGWSCKEAWLMLW